jgi:hypothetical protein
VDCDFRQKYLCISFTPAECSVGGHVHVDTMWKGEGFADDGFQSKFIQRPTRPKRERTRYSQFQTKYNNQFCESLSTADIGGFHFLEKNTTLPQPCPHELVTSMVYDRVDDTMILLYNPLL